MRLAALGGLGIIIGCGMYPRDQRAAWRDEAETACLHSGAVQPSEKIKPVEQVGDGSSCGMNHPFKVAELPQSHVALSKPTTMACSMIPALDNWVMNVVQPAAVRRFNTNVVEVETSGAYSCRRINGSYNMSEHAYGNAMDVSGFKLADGRRIRVGKETVSMPTFHLSAEAAAKSRVAALDQDWESYDLETIGEGPAAPGYGEPIEEAMADPFIDDVRQGACETFSTVLGPGQADHEEHLHIDLAHHAKGRRVCK